MSLQAVRRPKLDAQPAPKRDAILRAAIDVFAERGYFNAQVADVARAAGIAAGTVYLYFRSKDDLLVSIFDRTMREAIDEGRAALKVLLNAVVQVFEDFRYVDQVETGDAAVLVFAARVGDRELNGVDVLHFDSEGRVAELMVMVRPMSAVHALAEAMQRRLEAAGAL